MMHSISFDEGEKNTWDDWHLVSQVVPSFAPPKIRTNFVEVPGLSGKLDFSEALTGYPVFDNRTGTFEFIILNDLDEEYTPGTWMDLYSAITNYLDGRERMAILEDDPAFYYTGRFWVSNYQTGSSASEPRAKITIEYDVNPYKYSVRDSIEGTWFWDPFNFETDMINSSTLELTTDWKTIEYSKNDIGFAPICPTFRVETSDDIGAEVIFQNDDLGIYVEEHIPDGETTLHNLIIYGNRVLIQYKITGGTGMMEVVFRKGWL